MSQNLIFLKTQMYALKRQYGYPAAVYRTTAGATDLETGAKSITRVKYAIDNVIILPNKADTLGFYAAPLLQASRPFAYGGFQDQDLKFMMIDGEDLPVDFRLEQSDTIVYEHKKFEIVSLQEIEDQIGYLVAAKWLKGEAPNEVHEVSIFQRVRFVQTTTEVLNG